MKRLVGLVKKPGRSENTGEPSSPIRKRAPTALGVVAAAALAAVVAVNDRAPSPDDPLEECVAYAATLRRCFGDEAPITSPRPPHTAPERAAARKRCAADRARIERACH